MTSRPQGSETPNAKTAERKAPPAAEPTLEMLSTYYKSFHGSLYRQALSVVGCPDTANDIVQDAFTDTAARMKQGVEIKNPHAWLQAVVRNLCRNKISKRRMKNKRWIPLEDDLYLTDPATPTEIVHAKKRCEDVNRALDRLAPAQRSAFLLAELRGLEYREIADTLDRSEDSVRQLLARARSYIRNAVGPDASPLAAPLLPIGVRELRISRGPSLRDCIATRLADFHSSTASYLQHLIEVVSHPAAVLIAGTLLIGALNAPFAVKNLDGPKDGNGASAIAVAPLPHPSSGSGSSKQAVSPTAHARYEALSLGLPAGSPTDVNGNGHHAPGMHGDDIAPLEPKPAGDHGRIMAEPAQNDEGSEGPAIPGGQSDQPVSGGGKEPPGTGTHPGTIVDTEDGCNPTADHCDPSGPSTGLAPPSSPMDGRKENGSKPKIIEPPPKIIEQLPRIDKQPAASGRPPVMNSGPATVSDGPAAAISTCAPVPVGCTSLPSMRTVGELHGPAEQPAPAIGDG